jgi:acetylornithine aminotransferase
MISKILNTNTFEPILFKTAKGSWIWDTNGKKYLDCESGMWCVNLGHNHPKIIQAIEKQLGELIHRNKNFLTPITLEAAEKLLKFFPSPYDKLTFLNSGTEAMEFGINFAKKVTKREKVLSLQDSYLGAFGTAKTSSYTSLEGSKFKISYPICDLEKCSCLEKHQPLIDEIFHNYLNDIACFVLEPIMVSGGVFKPCKAFIQYICEEIQNWGGLVVIDEVTTGMGRVGYKFGYQLFDIIPDVVVLGKALGNGYPVSAVVTNSNLESKLSSSELYYVQSHQLDPLGAAVIKSVVNLFNEQEIIRKSCETALKIKNFLSKFNYTFIKEVRSYGMVFGIQIEPYNGMSSEKIILKLKDLLLDAGVLIGFNLNRSFIRFLPVLTIQNNEIEFLKEKMINVLDLI